MKIVIETYTNGERTEWHVTEQDVESLKDLLHACAFLFTQIIIRSDAEDNLPLSFALLEAMLQSSNGFLNAERHIPGPRLRVVDGRIEA